MTTISNSLSSKIVNDQRIISLMDISVLKCVVALLLVSYKTWLGYVPSVLRIVLVWRLGAGCARLPPPPPLVTR